MSEFIHDPGNETKIDRLYAFMSIDANGNHGIVAEILPRLGTTHLVTGSRKIAQTMIPLAQKVADRTGKKVGLFTFARVEGEELWQSE
jgi:hypothetical protein